PELRQLVESRLAQEATDARDARIVRASDDHAGARFGIRNHRAELVHVELVELELADAVRIVDGTQAARAALAKQHRSRRLDVDRGGDQRHQRRGDSEPDGRSQHVDRPFGDSHAAQHGPSYHAGVASTKMPPPIRLTVPGTLRYRNVAVRVVAEAARLVSGSTPMDPNDPLALDVRDPFDTAVISAFAEIFNNVAIHAYKRRDGGVIELAI